MFTSGFETANCGDWTNRTGAGIDLIDTRYKTAGNSSGMFGSDFGGARYAYKDNPDGVSFADGQDIHIADKLMLGGYDSVNGDFKPTKVLTITGDNYFLDWVNSSELNKGFGMVIAYEGAATAWKLAPTVMGSTWTQYKSSNTVAKGGVGATFYALELWVRLSSSATGKILLKVGGTTWVSETGIVTYTTLANRVRAGMVHSTNVDSRAFWHDEYKIENATPAEWVPAGNPAWYYNRKRRAG